MQQITSYKLEKQIKAIVNNINSGKCRNVFAAQNKIKTLRKELYQLKEQERFNNFLSL
jgi:serine/threonine-protein kinase RIO1